MIHQQSNIFQETKENDPDDPIDPENPTLSASRSKKLPYTAICRWTNCIKIHTIDVVMWNNGENCTTGEQL